MIPNALRLSLVPVLVLLGFTSLPATANAATCSPGTTNRTVRICTPSNNASVTSPVEVSAAATDSSTVTSMQIYVDGAPVYTKLSTKSIDTSVSMSAGTHRVTVQAKDSAGTFKSTVYVTVSGSSGGGTCGGTTNRTVTICSPTNGSTVGSPVQITAAATDSSAVTALQVYLDYTKVYEVTNTKTLSKSLSMSAGTHRLTVQAKDASGYFKSTINFTVSSSSGGGGCGSTTNRTVSICSPMNGSTVASPVQITATATDSSAVSVMQIYLDYTKVYQVTNTKTLSTSLSMASGTHRLTVQAKDASGYFKSTINFSVSGGTSGGGGGGTGTTAVTTWRNDLSRTGQNLTETTLTPSNVNATKFGKKFSYSVDGYVFAQPLVVPGLSIGGGTHNVVFVATQHDSVYAFDADGGRSSYYWKKSFIDPANGITTVPGSSVGVTNEWGVTATPVIDRANNTIYVLARTKNTTNNTYAQHLHALDLSTGAEKFGGPTLIQACVTGTGAGTSNGQVCFNPLRENSRVALTLLNGVVYLAWASLDDIGPYHGWVIGYSASNLQRVAMFNTTPNGSAGGIWQGGGGLSADGSGNLYAITGNGTFNAGNSNYGDTFLKLGTTGGNIVVSDYFTPYNQSSLSSSDLDLGSTAPLLLPNNSSTHPHEVLGAGKNGHAYLLDRDNMGKFQSGSNSQIVQELSGVFPGGVYTTPAYWAGRVYFIAKGDVIKQFSWSNGRLGTSPSAKGSHAYPYPGGNPTISANGSTNGIVWAVEKNSSGTAVLHAYDATNVAKELYSSAMNSTRDSAGPGVKFVVPTVANGKVYVGTTSKIVVYGLF